MGVTPDRRDSFFQKQPPRTRAPHTPDITTHGLSHRFRTAWQRFRPQPRFRNPVTDFQVAPTALEALAAPPAFRSGHGPYLSHHGKYTSLHLRGSTTDGVHATMDRTAPADLVFSYTRVMAAFPRFRPAPQTIGMLGLGGGSLAKYCYAHFPESRILVAEISPEVIALRRDFHIPDDDERFSIYQADGGLFVREHRRAFDVLLMDAFDEGGSLPHLSTRCFYQDCHRALTPGGVLVLNFSGDHWQASNLHLDRIFHRQIVLYECPDGDNTVAFATKGRLPAWVYARGESPA